LGARSNGGHDSLSLMRLQGIEAVSRFTQPNKPQKTRTHKISLSPMG
jgi:hypothetical protein